MEAIHKVYWDPMDMNNLVLAHILSASLGMTPEVRAEPDQVTSGLLLAPLALHVRYPGFRGSSLCFHSSYVQLVEMTTFILSFTFAQRSGNCLEK